MRILLVIVLAASAAVLCGCHHHDVQLLFPASSAGDPYFCTLGPSGVSTCVRAQNLDPARNNRETTLHVIMPPECVGSFNLITIHDADSSNPTVDVACSSPVRAPIR